MLGYEGSSPLSSDVALRLTGGGMPDSGKIFGTDLYELWQAGTQYLPAVAVHLREAESELESAGHHDDAFRRPDRFGGGNYGPAYGAIAELRQWLATMLRQTAENLTDVSAVLLLAANEFAETDRAAGDAFRDLVRGSAFGAD